MFRWVFALGSMALAASLMSCSAGDPATDDGDLDTTQQGATKCAGGVNGDGIYCTSACKCNAGEGDCDAPADCNTGLVCGNDNGLNFGLSASTDVCVKSHCTNHVLDVGAGETGVDCGGADCGTCSSCTGTNGGAEFCSSVCPCSSGQGDCDNDQQCQSGLTCATGKGNQWGFTTQIDICLPAHCSNGVQEAGQGETGVDCGGTCGTCPSCPANNTNNSCGPICRCAAGWGDCDGDAQCQTGLVCAVGVGAQWGLNAAFDVCVLPHCNNGQQDAAQGETGVDCGGADCAACPAAATPSTSCTTAVNACGPLGTENCCAVASVPGATFSRSYDAVGFTDSSNTATVSTYFLDKFEVSVGRFRKFVEAYDAWHGASNPASGAGAHPTISGSGWNSAWTLAADAATLKTNLACNALASWTDSAGSNEGKPINCVNYFEAFAFCAWDAGRLPTEAEWNNAAAGGTNQRVYPWSSPSTSTTVDFAHATYSCNADGTSGCAPSDIFQTGSLSAGAGRYGHRDLAGNMWELTLDYYAATYVNPCADCANLTTAQFRVIRGGSFQSSGPNNLRAGARSTHASANRLANVGFRCARQ